MFYTKKDMHKLAKILSNGKGICPAWSLSYLLLEKYGWFDNALNASPAYINSLVTYPGLYFMNLIEYQTRRLQDLREIVKKAAVKIDDPAVQAYCMAAHSVSKEPGLRVIFLDAQKRYLDDGFVSKHDWDMSRNATFIYSYAYQISASSVIVTSSEVFMASIEETNLYYKNQLIQLNTILERLYIDCEGLIICSGERPRIVIAD